MSIDMELGEQWPAAVNVEIQVHYRSGAPEHLMFAVEPCAMAHAVRVVSPRPGLEPLQPHPVGWFDLPGRTMYQRCLSVLALHWFGSVDMAPRVRGVPLWRSLSVEMTMPSATATRLKFDLQVSSDTRATLRYQFRRDQPLVSRTVDLDALDADPLRALLRVALGRVKPVAAPRRAASPRPRPPSRVDSSPHAAAPCA